MEKYVVFHVEGGLGKNVASTAVVKNVAKKYPDRKLIVMASFPEIYLNNPHVYRVYAHGNAPYFWENYINGKDTIILRREPYFENNHINQVTPLHETWHQMYDLDYDRKKDLPELHMNMMQSEFHNSWRRDRPILLLHTNGGPIQDGQPVYSWTRDMPRYIIESVVQNFANQFHIIQICKDKTQSVNSPHVETVDRKMTNFELFSLVKASQKRLLIDSCLQHAAAAYGLPSVVLWIGTHPEMFGYDIHTNIKANPPKGNVKNIDGSYFDYQLDGRFHECPYNNPAEMFNVTKIIQELNKN